MASTIIAVLEDWSNIYVHHEAPLEQSNFSGGYGGAVQFF